LDGAHREAAGLQEIRGRSAQAGRCLNKNGLKRRRAAALLGAAALAPIRSGAQERGVVDQAALARLAGRLALHSNVHALLVARGGRTVFERYFSGPDEVMNRRVRDTIFDADTLHDMKSVTKSVASLALGVALDRGLIPGGLDRPLFDFFPELSDLRTPKKAGLLLHHAVTMTLGLRWIEAEPATEGNNDEDRMRRAEDPCRYVLGLPIVAPPGRDFFYNTGALALLATIFKGAVGRPLDDFAREVLFEPLGIKGTEWRHWKGEVDVGGGLRLHPRDMIKLGQLVLQGGRWEGRQIVSPAWIEASTAPHVVASARYRYGYLWWLGRSPWHGREIEWVAALGRGGQSIRIVPALDLVVAVTAGYYQDYSPQTFALQAGVFAEVLEAVQP
jgi:CubicO group peptidase (beta-lactamase class C family)